MTKIDTPQEWLDKQYDEYKKYVFNKINNLIEERQSKLNESYDESRETVLVNILKSIENKPSYERIFEDILDMLDEDSMSISGGSLGDKSNDQRKADRMMLINHQRERQQKQRLINQQQKNNPIKQPEKRFKFNDELENVMKNMPKFPKR